jgi:hypothetical protein
LTAGRWVPTWPSPSAAREPRSFAALVPAILDRAALFRAPGIGAWTYWLLGALVGLAVPALLVLALGAAERDRA